MALWEELARVHSGWNMTWCLIVDFNIIRYLSERFGCKSFISAMFAFSDFIEANYLVDLLLKGLLSPGLEIQGQIVCQELIGHWHCWVGWINSGMCLKWYFLG